MKTLGERFRWRREQLGLTQEDAVREINRTLQGERKLTRVTISNIENGMQDSMKDKVLLAVIQVLKCNAEWLINNRGPVDNKDSIADHLSNSLPQAIRLAPLLHWDQTPDHEIVIKESDFSKYYPCPQECNLGTFCLKVNSESMLPRFEVGDLIFIDPSIKTIENNKFFILLNESNGDVLFKQISVIDNAIYLKSLNPDYPPEIKFVKIEKDHKVIGTIISHVKSV
ncbi:S24 family peptidase [Serratia sp. BW106]|uniref:helix-turn-helix domain-containing protein n=1 Tax=Serratia sp. BW106 TaxID=1884636 RepID=UPI000BFFD517|nr:S24 family peptidase [Serratia sp. BW106]